MNEIRVLHYAVQLARGAVKVGLCLEYSSGRDPDTHELLDRSWAWRVWLDGVSTPIDDVGAVIQIAGQDEPYVKGERITEAEYDYLVQDRAWARQHAPDAPEANPRKTIDLLTCKIPF